MADIFGLLTGGQHNICGRDVVTRQRLFQRFKVIRGYVLIGDDHDPVLVEDRREEGPTICDEAAAT